MQRRTSPTTSFMTVFFVQATLILFSSLVVRQVPVHAFSATVASPLSSTKTTPTATAYDWPPSSPTFFEEQIHICRSIVAEADEYENDNDNIEKQRQQQQQCDKKNRTTQRFVEHPRCTARFGEVLRHAKNEATSMDDYQKAIYNARAVLRYVDGNARKEGSSSSIIRKGLTNDLVMALTSRSLRNFRQRQLQIDKLDVPKTSKKDAKDEEGDDYTPEDINAMILGRLYYSAIRAAEPILSEVSLIPDHCGFTVLLALCRAASALKASTVKDKDDSDSKKNKDANKNNNINNTSLLTTSGSKLDTALSSHFNGIAVPGCRFLFSPRHGKVEVARLPQSDGASSISDAKSRRPQQQHRKSRATRLVIAFSSLGNGLVRHEFGNSMAKLNNGNLYDGIGGDFDVLFVADPSQSWYQKDSQGGFQGFEEYQTRIRAASKPYEKVSMVGDSMGGSAALLFSHLATDSVVAFSPQVDLGKDSHHVSRDDMTKKQCQSFQNRLVQSVRGATTSRKHAVHITIHRGIDEMDVWHTNKLLACLDKDTHGENNKSNSVQVVEHTECTHHQIAVYLKRQGTLLSKLSQGLFTT